MKYPVIPEKFLNDMHRFNLSGTGRYCFSILTRDDLTGYQLHERPSQPCFGELRKYRDTHGIECTQPDDRRPTDLHHPFPHGTPVAVGVKLNGFYGPINTETQTSEKSILLRCMFTEGSHWDRGFKDVEFTLNSKKQVAGLIVKNTKIDPTVLVNALKIAVNTEQPECKLFIQLHDAGLSVGDAILLARFFPHFHEYGIGDVGSRIWNFSRLDLKRWKSRDPHDFTRGTLYDRFDYCRKQAENIYNVVGADPFINIGTAVRQRFNYHGYHAHKVPLGEFVQAAQDVLK